jgi:hypothetical protein
MSACDYVTAIEVLRLAVWVEAALRLMPLSRVLERMRRDTSRRTDPRGTGADYLRLGRFVAVAYDVLPLPSTCLRQSLVLHGMLERRGVASRLCLGVAKQGPALEAHAWIECNGVPIDVAVARFGELQPYRS